MQLVGIERGDDATFRDPPFYDRVALERAATDRIVLASFSLSDAERLPTRPSADRSSARAHDGRGRARLRLAPRDAGAADGQPIAAELSFEIQTER